jgi:hypothetical protein
MRWPINLPRRPPQVRPELEQSGGKEMTIIVNRQASSDDATIGEMLIDDVHEAWTLEPTIREVAGEPVSEWKIPSKTAIPAGTYNVTIAPSARFGREMPHVNDVDGFAGIEIHWGNFPIDTDGCTLLGTDKGSAMVKNSVAAFNAFFPKLQAALTAGDTVTITYVNPTPILVA